MMLVYEELAMVHFCHRYRNLFRRYGRRKHGSYITNRSPALSRNFRRNFILLLLGIAMPLKYAAGIPEAVSVVGAAHGALFVLYALAVVHVKFAHKWSIGRSLFAFLMSVIPFGPFILERQLKRTVKEKNVTDIMFP